MLHILVIFLSTQLWNCGGVSFLTKSSPYREKQQQNRSKNQKSFFLVVLDERDNNLGSLSYSKFQRDCFKVENFFHDDDSVFTSSLEKN